MARDSKIRMPSSTAGITQYWDDASTKIHLKPEHVVILLVLIILIEIVLHSNIF